MPAVLTHDFFGRDVLRKLPQCSTGSFVLDDHEAQDSFLLGCQGPDPFFYAQFMPNFTSVKQFGSTAHREKVDETLAALRRVCFSESGDNKQLLTAYALGFLCHFKLDSVMHPFVYSQQYAICDAGVKNLDRSDGFNVHVYLEGELDMMMMYQRHGCALRGHDWRSDVLNIKDNTLNLLDFAYRAVAHEVYCTELAPKAFSQGVRDMRKTFSVLYSPTGVKRYIFGKVERVFRRHSSLQALCPRNDVGDTSIFDNREKAEWTNPFTDEVSTASFAELYECALEKVLVDIEAFMDGRPIEEITGGLTFEGKPAHLPQDV